MQRKVGHQQMRRPDPLVVSFIYAHHTIIATRCILLLSSLQMPRLKLSFPHLLVFILLSDNTQLHTMFGA